MQADNFFTWYVGQHVWHRLLLFCRKRTLVLDALNILVSIELCYVGWGNFLVAESLQHCCTCFINFGFSSLAFSNKVFFISQPSLFTPTLIPLNHDLRRVFLRPSYGLLPNKTGFLFLSCSQVFSLEIDFTEYYWVFLTTVRGNQFRSRRPYIRYVCASLCFRLPFAVLYKLFIISCFNQSYITLAQIVMLLN